MKRREFLKNLGIATAAVALAPYVAKKVEPAGMEVGVGRGSPRALDNWGGSEDAFVWVWAAYHWRRGLGRDGGDRSSVRRIP